MKIPSILLPAILVCSLFSCGEEDVPLNNFQQDLAEVFTDADGKITSLVTDDGTSYSVSNAALMQPLRPDTVYRTSALYVRSADKAEIISLTSIVSPKPIVSDATIKNAPLRVDAVWRGGRYANLLLTIPTSNKAHKFAFVDRGYQAQAEGHLLQTIELYHDNNGDGDFYERQVYLSCPLYGFGDILQAGRDSVEMRIQTPNGLYTKRLPF